MSRRALIWTAKFLVSFGILVWLFSRTDIGELLSALTSLNLLAFAAGMLSFACGVLLRSYKWLLLLRVQGSELSYASCTSISFISMFFNNFFLGTLGGDAYRIYGVSDSVKSVGSATSSVIMERATGFFSALFLATITGILLVFRQDVVASVSVIWAISLITAIALVGFLVFLLVGRRLTSLPVMRRFTRTQKFIDDFFESVIIYKNHLPVVVLALLLALVFYVVQGVTIFFFAWAANSPVSLLNLCFIMPLVSILVVLPISINGFGIREGSLVLYLEQIGVGGSAALLIAISSRVGNVLISLIGGMLFLERMWRRPQAESPTPPQSQPANKHRVESFQYKE